MQSLARPSQGKAFTKEELLQKVNECFAIIKPRLAYQSGALNRPLTPSLRRGGLYATENVMLLAGFPQDEKIFLLSHLPLLPQDEGKPMRYDCALVVNEKGQLFHFFADYIDGGSPDDMKHLTRIECSSFECLPLDAIVGEEHEGEARGHGLTLGESICLGIQSIAKETAQVKRQHAVEAEIACDELGKILKDMHW